MNKFVLISLCFLSTAAIAVQNSYNLKMDLVIGEGQSESFEVILPEGQNSSITSESNGQKTMIEVEAGENRIENKKGTLLKLKISTVDKMGQKTLIGTPQLLVSGSEPASMTVQNKAGKQLYKVDVTVKKNTK